jgi:hypothetical protein
VGGVIVWRGRLRCGAEQRLDGTWVRSNFKPSFCEAVVAAGGPFRHVSTGCARERLPDGTDDIRDGPKVLSARLTTVKDMAECPLVAYPQGSADLCVAYGLASAMHEYGDTMAATAIAASARAALASGDAFGHMRTVVRSMVAGWSERPLAHHQPLAAPIADPVHLQLVGSDGSGTHAVATLGGLVFDSAEECALPLSRATLDRCVGHGATFSHVARAVRLVPGPSVRKWIRKHRK